MKGPVLARGWAGSATRTTGRRPGTRTITPPTVTQSRATADVTGTPTGGVAAPVEVEVPVVVPTEVEAVGDVGGVESGDPTEASDVRVISSEPSAPSRPTSARAPIRTHIGGHYRDTRLGRPLSPRPSTLRPCLLSAPARMELHACSFRHCLPLCSSAPAV